MTRQQIESVLERVRPFLQADGGDIELVEIDGQSAGVRLTGACSSCPSARMTLVLGVEAALRREVPEFDRVYLR